MERMAYPPFSLRLLITTLALSLPALCSSMAAWYANNGVQYLMQGEDDYLYYSYCHTNFDVVFPKDQPLKLPVSTKPSKDTPLAGVGWWDDEGKTTWACIWYIDSFGDLIYKRFRCDPAKGEFETKDEQIITDEIQAAVSLNNRTGLAAVLLGATDGIRLYFHDNDDAIHSLMFTNDRGWKYEQIISPDQSRSARAIGAVNRITKANEITLITPKDSENMEETRLDRDTLWHISTFPTALSETNVTDKSPEGNYLTKTWEGPQNGSHLAAWDGQPGNIGVALGPDYRSLFYIGTDKGIHQLNSFPKGNKNDSINSGDWQTVTDQEEKYWPKADEANANFAMAGWLDDKGGHVYMYYMVGGELTLAMYENNTWYDAEAVPTVLPPKTEDKPEAKKKKGLSDGAKAGIGVAAFVGAFAIAFLIGAIIFLRRRRQQQRRDQEAAAAAQLQGQQAPPYQPGPDGMYQPYSPPYDQQGHISYIGGQAYTYVPAVSPEPIEPKIEGSPEATELPERQMQSYEMLGEGHFREMPANPQTTYFEDPSPNSELGDIPIRRG